MLFDATVLGTPVQLLQIPGAVQQAIISSMQRNSCTQHMFTQDGKQFADLSKSVLAADFRRAHKKDVQVSGLIYRCNNAYLSRLDGRVASV